MLIEPLFAHAAKRPDEIAITDDKGRYSYRQLAAMATGLAAHIAQQTQAANVGLLIPPAAGFVGSFYGTLLAGKCAVLINYLLGDKELAHIIKDSGIDTVLTIPQLAPRVSGSGLKVIDLSALHVPHPPAEAGSPKMPGRGADDLAVVIYTSGTSGLPKGVMLTYGNLQSDVDAAIEHARLQHEHRFLGVIPLFHSFGMTAMMLAPIQLGAMVIYMSRFSAMAALKAIREQGASMMFGVPSMYGAILRLKDAKPEDFKNVYAMISGGEPLSEAVRVGFKDRFGVTLLEGYGLSETSPVVALNIPQENRPGSVGKPVPGAVFKLVNDDGNAVAATQSGEIWVKGPMIMKGYLNLPNETAAALTSDRYFKTGDLGRFDEDGFLYITGRKKELIIVAGEKASPREIEDVLMRHAAVGDAAVLGKKDPSRGEVVVAFVIFKENQSATPDELRDFCREQGLAQWKMPREIFVVPDLPRSPTGKVLKRVLAEKLVAESGK
ncbi:MAG TPA: AMP-binding protein [Tepidisphaeraceae bacterium]|jgi:long-chain acyl-CoA synthetase|nr:AMP-binding protein [Tepidisphaeraceae bacterium]